MLLKRRPAQKSKKKEKRRKVKKEKLKKIFFVLSYTFFLVVGTSTVYLTYKTLFDKPLTMDLHKNQMTAANLMEVISEETIDMRIYMDFIVRELALSKNLVAVTKTGRELCFRRKSELSDSVIRERCFSEYKKSKNFDFQKKE